MDEAVAELEMPPWTAAVNAGTKRGGPDEPQTPGRAPKKGKAGGKGSNVDAVENQLVPLVAKLSLILARDVAMLKSNCLRTFFVPEAAWIATTGLAANQKYHQDVEKLREKAKTGEEVDMGSLGPPHIMVFYVVMSEIKKRASTPRSAELVNSFWQTTSRASSMYS